jgi:hypothetical protein
VGVRPTRHSNARRSAAAPQHEPPRRERLQCRFKAGEVAAQQQVERAAGRARGPRPALEHGRAGALLGLREQLEQDWELGLVLELSADQLERIRVQRGQQLLVGEAEQLLQVGGLQNSWFSPPNTPLTEPSVKMLRIDSVSRSAHESTRMFSGAPGPSGIVSVTTISSNAEAARFS